MHGWWKIALNISHYIFCCCSCQYFKPKGKYSFPSWHQSIFQWVFPWEFPYTAKLGACVPGMFQLYLVSKNGRQKPFVLSFQYGTEFSVWDWKVSTLPILLPCYLAPTRKKSMRFHINYIHRLQDCLTKWIFKLE